MADQISSLILAADSRQVRNATADLGRMSEAGKKVEASTDSMSEAFSRLGSAIKGVGVLELARQAVQAADAYSAMNSRLSLVTSSAENLAQVQGQLFDIAQRTRVSFAQTSDLYGSLARSTKTLGVSQQDVARTTETINKALILSGGSAASAEAALVQLGQAFASGVLRGEELNSVMEQAPRLAEAIADGLGVTRGALRELGSQGELTAEKVFQALQKAAISIDRDFNRMSATVGQGVTQVSNAMLRLVGSFDQASGTTSSLAAIMADAAEAIDSVARALSDSEKVSRDFSSGAGFLLTVMETIKVLGSDVSFVLKGIGRDLGGMAAQMAALSRGDFSGAARIGQMLREDAAAARKALDDYQKGVLTRGAGGARVDTSVNDAESRRFERTIGPAAKAANERVALEKFLAEFSTAGEKFRAEVKKQKEALGSLYTDDVEKRLREKFFPKAGEATKAFERELQSERERLALIGQETELERVKALIKAGAFKNESAQQIATRQYIAIEIDRANELVQLKKDEEKARDAVTAAITRAAQAANKELEDLDTGNEKLAKEIELLGASEQARAAIERAYISSTIARKQDQIAALESQGVDERQMQLLELEIKLLKERQELLKKRADRKDEVEAQEAAAKAAKKAAEEGTEFAKQAARNIQDAMGDTILKSLEGDFKSIGDLWANLIKKMAAEALAAQLGKALFGDFGKTGEIGGGVGSIFSAIGSYLVPQSPFWANGGAFGVNGPIKGFANGDVFGSPTAFRYAGDRLGILGEAGEEAIMPLRRGKDGKLGVSAAGGGGPQITHQWNIAAGVTRNELMAMIPEIEKRAEAKTMAALRRPGVRV